jgi:hypothetical protein
MAATARRAALCVPLAILFTVVQRATVSARAADPIKAVSACAHQGVTSKQVKRPEIDFCRPRRSPRLLAHAGKGSAPLRRIGARS